ncbi:hypothetical protein Trydic_g5200 [Trypoxylus dichotomus]
MELITWLSIVIISAVVISIILGCCCKRYREGRVIGPAAEPNVYVTETTLVQPVHGVHPANVTYVSMQQPGVPFATTQTVVAVPGPPQIGWQQPPPRYSETFHEEPQRTTTEHYAKQPSLNPNY